MKKFEITITNWLLAISFWALKKFKFKTSYLKHFWIFFKKRYFCGKFKYEKTKTSCLAGKLFLAGPKV
jgi:hypothetical protein